MSRAPAPAAWPTAADGLARRVTRRTRAGVLLTRLAAGTGAGAIVAAALRGLGGAGPAPALLATGIVALLGLAWGLRAATRVAAVRRGEAAWALDRVAGARERGLTAALVGGVAGAEAAYAGSPPIPPPVRLLPPTGIAPLVAAGLLAALVLAWPGPKPAAAGGPRGATSPGEGAEAAALEAGRRETAAGRAAREAARERAVREVLGLPAHGPLDPTELAERLARPGVRDAAREAAEPGGETAAALAEAGPSATGLLARALDAGSADRAEALRREAASLRAAAGALPIPPARRPLVARYLAGRLAPHAGTTEGPR